MSTESFKVLYYWWNIATHVFSNLAALVCLLGKEIAGFIHHNFQSSLLTPVLFTTTADAAEIAMLAKNQVIFNIVPHGLVPRMHHQYTI